MIAVSILLSLLAALGFYLACAHQTFWPGARAHARALRTAAWPCAALAAVAAMRALGVWAGAFAASSALMLALVSLPYLDAWRRTRGAAGKGNAHVG